MLVASSITLGVAAPAALSAEILAPALIFLLAAGAAVGMVLLLPGRRESSFRKIGAALLIAAAIILAVVLGKQAGGMNAYFWIFAAIAVFSAVRVITHPRPVYSALYFVMTVMASAGLFVLMWAEFMAAALVIIYAGAILITYVFVIMLASQAAPAGSSSMGEQLAEHDAISREPVVASAIGLALLGVFLFVIFDRSVPFDRDLDTSSDTSAQLTAALQSKDITSEVFTDPTTQPSVDRTGTGSIGRANFSPDKTIQYNFEGPTNLSPAANRFVPVGGTQELGEYLFTKQLVNMELAGLILTLAMVGAIVIARKRVVGGVAFDESQPEVLTAAATPVDDNPHSIPVVGTRNPRQKEYPQT